MPGPAHRAAHSLEWNCPQVIYLSHTVLYVPGVGALNERNHDSLYNLQMGSRCLFSLVCPAHTTSTTYWNCCILWLLQATGYNYRHSAQQTSFNQDTNGEIYAETNLFRLLMMIRSLFMDFVHFFFFFKKQLKKKKNDK